MPVSNAAVANALALYTCYPAKEHPLAGKVFLF
jgi:hypothetical protein